MPEQTRTGLRSANLGRLVEQVSRLPEGKELLEAIDRECGYRRTVFAPGCERQNNFNQGKQHVANWLHEKHDKYLIQGSEDEK